MAARSRELRVVISGDATNLNKAFNRAGHDAERAQGKVHKFGLNIGTAFKAAGAAIAASAVVDQIKESVKAAEAAQVAQEKLATQLKAVGISYGSHAKQISEVIDKTSALSGISGKDLEGALTSVVRGTGSLKDGLRGVAIAADLARAKHMDVAKAGDLVAKVYNGNVGALKRMGISLTPVTAAQDKLKESTKHATVEQTRAAKEADKTATAQKALGLLQRRVGGQAEAYGKTAAGAQDRFRVAVEHLREKIGGALLPVLTKVAGKAATFVDQMTAGTGAGGRFAAKLQDIANKIKPIVKFFTEHPRLIAVAVGAWATYRVAAAAALTVSRLKLLGMFTGLGRKAAVGGAEAGGAFGTAASTTASTRMGRFGWSGLGGKIGTALGVAAGAAAAVEVANALSKTDFIQGIADKIGTALGIIDPKPVRDRRKREADHAQRQREHSIKHPIGSGTTGPPISLPKVAAGHPSGVVTHHPRPAPHLGTTAHGAVAHTSSAVGDPQSPADLGAWYAAHDRPMPKVGRMVGGEAPVRKGKLKNVVGHRGIHRAGREPLSPQAHLASAATGGAQPHPDDIIAAIEGRADKIDRAHVPYQWGGGHGGRFTGTVIPMDCSGAVSAALGIDPRVSGDFVTWGSPGDGGSRGVTIYANSKHVLMKINGRFWGTSRSNPGGGPGWIDGGVSASYLNGFTARHMKAAADASGGTTAPSAPTGADYARHAAHRVAPITSAFGHASGLEGRHVSAAGTAVDTYTHQISQAGRIFDRSQEDLNTIPGRIQRVSELSTLQILQKGKLVALRREVVGKKRQITLKRQEITRLTVAMRRGSKHQRPAIRGKIRKLQGDIKTLKADIRQLGFDVDDAVQDVADTDTEIGTIQAGPQDKPDPLTGTAAIPGADAYSSILNRDAALAALTPDTADDLDVARRQQAAAAAILAYEQARPGQFTPDDVAQAATNLKSANDAVAQLAGTSSDAVNANTDAINALKDEIKRQNDFASSVANVTSREAVRALADVISGQITGTGYDPRAMTAGAGNLARY